MINWLNVLVMSQQQVLYQGQAQSVSSENTKGPFDVLSEHANFITLIKNRLTIQKTATDAITLPVTDGVLRVYQNSVTVFLGLNPHELQQTIQAV